jgi:23S rRNA (cytidine1920-2'-O)/16S rRNA (cytidine1409-2'-O)-methyltransferase
VVRVRADQLMVDQGLAENRTRARALIMAGRVAADGRPILKAGENLPEEALLNLKGDEEIYASRGGRKLEGALGDFSLVVDGLNVLDVGASTGGFTDCLLKRGAAKVTALDVGYGLLDWRLRQDSRVTVLERVNVRHVAADLVNSPFDLITVDVSFISLTLVIEPVMKLLRPTGRMLVMVKPQFEVGRENVGRGGVVRDPNLQAQAVDKVRRAAESVGFKSLGAVPSRLKGPKGNQEHFLLLAWPDFFKPAPLKLLT